VKVNPVNNKGNIHWKDLMVFLFFVVLAFCFWCLQYFQQKMERDVFIPIRYVHVPKDIALHDSLPTEMMLRLADKGTVFVQHFFGHNNLFITIDLATLATNSNGYRIERANLYAQIKNLVPNTTQIISFRPETIQIHYSPLKKKELPVRIDGIIYPAAGYVFTDSLRIEPSRIWVYGDKKTLDTLQYISTEAVKKENVQKKLVLTLSLNAPKSVHLSAQKVKLTVETEEYTEKKFELPVICRNLPANMNARFFPSTVEVVCRLPISKYTLLNKHDLEVGVDYNELSLHPGTTVLPVLLQKPQWLIDYRLAPETVEYLIEQKRDL
jgi:hypothetical protein